MFIIEFRTVGPLLDDGIEFGEWSLTPTSAKISTIKVEHSRVKRWKNGETLGCTLPAAQWCYILASLMEVSKNPVSS